MKQFALAGFLCLLLVGFLITQVSAMPADQQLQIPTVSIPTVTGTPINALITVRPNETDQIHVRAGPSAQYYPEVGVLVVGQQVPALGRTAGGDWIEIAYPGAPGGVGWVYEPLVDVDGTLPIVAPPATPTPRVTPTIDPTMAAQFLIEFQPTRLPTFTPAPPVNIPTFQPIAVGISPSRVPMGLVIVGMAVVGLFGTLISFLRGR